MIHVKRAFVQCSIGRLDWHIDSADLIPPPQLGRHQFAAGEATGAVYMSRYMSRPSTSNIVSDPPPNTEEQTRAICAAHGDRPDELIEILHALQAELGFVPEPALPVIANALNLSRAEVYGVLSFYHDFRRAPAGRHVVKICRAEACQALHTEEVCRHAERRLGVKLGETSANGEFTLEAVYCLGNCALSPAMMIDGNLFGCVDKKRFDAIIESLDQEAA